MSYSPFSSGYRTNRPPTIESLGYRSKSRKRALRDLIRVTNEQSGTDSGRNALNSVLFDRVTDSKVLRATLDRVEAEGGDAPGPNGVRIVDLSNAQRWQLCRRLQEALRAQTYRPGPSRQVSIPKSSGTGERVLTVQNIQDRVVASALNKVLRPLIVPQLHATAHSALGSRDELLARAQNLVERQGFRCAVVSDIRDAFGNVPVGRLVQLLPRLISCPRLEALVNRIAKGNQAGKGIAQGNALSPLLLDVYLDHHLHRLWHARHPELPLLRYVDDLLVLCPSDSAAREAANEIETLLKNCGLPVKHSVDEAVISLGTGQRATWLGMDLRLVEGLEFAPSEEAWQQLEARIAECHEELSPMLICRLVIQAWAAQLGPATTSTAFEQIYQRIQRIAAGQGFSEIQASSQLLVGWNSVALAWQRRVQG